MEATRALEKLHVHATAAAILILAAGISCQRDLATTHPEKPAAAPVARPDVHDVAKRWLTPDDIPRTITRRTPGLAGNLVSDVASGVLSKAVDALDSRPWKVLSKEEAASYCATPIEPIGDRVFVLLRGVEMNQVDPGDDRIPDVLRVIVGDGVVSVTVGGSRFSTYSLRPRPVVALLPAEPKKLAVFITYQVLSRAEGGANSEDR